MKTKQGVYGGRWPKAIKKPSLESIARKEATKIPDPAERQFLNSILDDLKTAVLIDGRTGKPI